MRKMRSRKSQHYHTYVHTQTFYDPSRWSSDDEFTFVFTFLSDNAAATWHEFGLDFEDVSAAFSTNGEATDTLLFLRRGRCSNRLFWGPPADVSSSSSAVLVTGFSNLLSRISDDANRAVTAAAWHSHVTMHVTVHTVSLAKPRPGRPLWRPAHVRTGGEESADVSLELTCPVCWEDFSAETVTWTPCWHGFHRKCIESWLKKNCSCPMCRLPVLPTNIPLTQGINIFLK